MYSCSVWHNAHVKTWALGIGAFAVLWGCAVGLLWSWVVWTWDLAVLGMLTRYPYWALCVQNDSGRKWSAVSMDVTLGDSEVWSWPSLSTGVSWISVFPEVYGYRRCWMYVLFFLFGRSLFLWLLLVCERFVCMCPISEVPTNGETNSGILLL